jgi:hypothetical protein
VASSTVPVIGSSHCRETAFVPACVGTRVADDNVRHQVDALPAPISHIRTDVLSCFFAGNNEIQKNNARFSNLLRRPE